MSEQWRPVVGFEGCYEVSDQGRVRSHDRVVTQSNRWGTTMTYRKVGRTMRGRNRNGYRVVTLQDAGRVRDALVHVLVLEAFCGARPSGYETRHLNGHRDDNALGNLRWGTHKENQADRLVHGTSNRAEDGRRRTKISATEARAIRRASGLQREIAAQFGVSQSLVSLIKLGKAWSYAA